MENEPKDHEHARSPTVRAFVRERFWFLVSIALLAAATVLLRLAYTNASFVIAALGVSAWFLNLRMSLKRRHDLVKLSGRNWVPRGEIEEDEERQK
jgi:hypothetical protein